MVKIILSFFIALTMGCSVINNTDKIQQLFEFNSIHIDSNGSYSGYISFNETTEYCKTFVLKKSEVVDFFKQSRAVTSREYAHDLMASNCYASGGFILSTGIAGTWKIDRARRGMINFDNGDDTKYYYCSECKSTLFYESCDIECVHGQ
ncbi:MAG: hypothetical protein L3J98_03380 [Gammaproteobacteria bacterium]|nr:hypothetical protein [Gammaproteobacteria bacterium]MCF6259192.1 hypothetical protein [Gammaproteobacteria bacterium]